MSSVPNPIDNPDLFSAIVLGGKRSPGKVTLSGHDRTYKIDVKEASGQAGASTTLQGIAPTQFTATFSLMRDAIDEFAAWPEFQDIIEKTVSGKEPKAITIYHPALKANNINSVILAKMGGATEVGKGETQIVVTFQEYFPPKKAGGAVGGSKDKAKKVDPNQDLQNEIARLRKEYEKPIAPSR